ncbi:YceH family protein [Catenovulum maritimum]|uniref:Uncharacterized protein n=1 Tax=Catenovulum maritimum TaxID=1513271 RepID=A0A0J8GWX5_9ALTE|nr:DUF480 domain-containing protein [Catenovulum maritimum]KMT65779.1 hypothetical protein XM47_07185 [Catenovulum maritimum]
MKNKLTAEQLRVLGVMLEKQVTTPDQYPMSINGITTACNQKSNREPIVDYSESQVQNVVDELVNLRLLSDTGPSGRVTKYRHRFYGSDFSSYQFSQEQAAILCVLFLRGPQTPGELRTRTQRLASFSDVQQIESCLQELAEHADGSFVVKLEREPGKRESRFAHLFADVEISQAVAATTTSTFASNNDSELQQRVDELEQSVAELKAELAELKQLILD